MIKTRSQKLLKNSGLGIGLVVILTACTNSGLPRYFSQNNATNGTGATTTLKGDVMPIASITIAPPTGSSTTTTTGTTVTDITAVFFDTAKSPVPIANHCTASTGSAAVSKPCICQFSWQQINNTSGAAVTIPRLVQTQVTSVQPNVVQCNAPDVYTNPNEIPEGTVIKITVLPGPGNGVAFTVPTFSYTKNSNSVLGSFQDAQGHSFDNILHYSCYEQFVRGMTIQSKIETVPITAGGNTVQVSFPSASQYCVRKFNDTSGTTTVGCETLPLAENSAQSYYYNLYIRDSERGDINTGNLRYICPTVKEALGGNSTVGTSGNFYPLDSNFSLSLAPTPNFNVAVESFSKTSNGSDPVSANSSSCYPPTTSTTSSTTSSTTTSTADSSSLVQSCLGFAAKPNADGTCPYFNDSNGNIRLTYRLRRYVAIYPPTFDTGGQPIQQPQATDTIYVLDRPVFSATADPLKPFTMKGPKPCPFAYFDKKGVTAIADPNYAAVNNGLLPTYAATDDARWTGTNIDGIQFPNTDSPVTNSCSAAVPVLNGAKTLFGIATVNAVNPALKQLYIRPVRAWIPHYVEDTDFQACAPQATPMKDPPLHFARDSLGNVSWCAESYPSQNDNVPGLELKSSVTGNYIGDVVPFTSHVAKNSASAQCTATIPSSIPLGTTYPIPGVAPACRVLGAGTPCNPQPAVNPAPELGEGNARHLADLERDIRCDKTTNPPQSVVVCAPNTCDRTVISSGITWPRFPLLAPPHDVELAISGDNSYNCTVSFDNGGPKSTNNVTPAQGCCGAAVDVWTGLPAGANVPVQLLTSGAHLEPDAACLVPTY